MANVMDEIATRLATDLSLTQGTDLFKGRQPMTPDACLTLISVGGPEGIKKLGGAGLQYEYPRLQVVCRGAPEDYQTPNDQADSAYKNINEIEAESLSGTEYLFVTAQPPYLLEVDELGRVNIAFSAQFEKELSA